MHANLSVTDGVYGIFSEGDIRAGISALLNSNPEKATDQLIYLARQFLDKLECNNRKSTN